MRTGSVSWRDALGEARRRLAAAGVENAGQEALWLAEVAGEIVGSAQVDTASTFTLSSAPTNRMCRSNRAPRGGSGTQVSAVTVSPAATLPR